MLVTLFKCIDHIETHTQTIHTQPNIPATVSGNSAPVSPLTLKLSQVRQSQDSVSNVFCVSESRKKARQMVHACVCVKEKVKLARPV